ncbi:MAG: serine/threonine protein kinase, partial [Ideonella sp.]|nr:serine/threonine protein kinase [Ideonella sp.]
MQRPSAPEPATPPVGNPHAPTLSADAIAAGPAPVGNALPVGTYLGEFELTDVIGEGGFGIVYLAKDHSLQRRIALKEYMPSSLAERTSGMQVSSLSEEDEETFRKGLDSFINEARLLAQFDHPSLVKVHRFWEANGTAYMVMPFYEGPTLKDVLRNMPGPPDEAWLRGLLEPLTEVLAVIHGQQCYHRDIAPDNILLLAGSGRPLLLDFGAARRVIGDANQALTVILKPGYAPVEQYAEVPGMKQGPWTDVYALAAVVYFAITGKKPPPAVGRLLNDQYVPLVQQAAGRYTEAFLSAIDRALVVKPSERTQNIDAFRAALGFGALARDAAGALSNTNGTQDRPVTAPAPAPTSG